MTDLASLAGLIRSLAIYYGRPWRLARTARFYAQFVRPGDIAFDIGAHVGNRTRALRRAGARVVALEPQRLFFRFLGATLSREVTLLPVAAGRAPATATMTVSRRHPTVSTLTTGFGDALAGVHGFRDVAWDSTQAVEITTLDRLIAVHGVPAFVKIDVEGHEAEVLAGLGQPVAAVAFEYLPPAIDAALASVDRLAQLGDYQFNAVEGEQMTFVLPAWTTAAGMRSWLNARAPGQRSGDVYARLRRREFS